MQGIEKFVGLKLKDIVDKYYINTQGVAVFLLEDKNDLCGKRVAEDFSIRLVLEKNPELAERKIIRANDFYGQDVYRVL